MHKRFMLGAIPYFAATFFLSACGGSDASTADDSNANIGSASNAVTVTNLEISGPGRLSALVESDASITLRTSATGCRNHPGPYITIDGELKLGGVSANLIFRNNRKGTHETDPISAALYPIITVDNGTIVLPKSNKYGTGVGGNPLIAIQLEDKYGKPIGDIINLGRCNRLKTSTTITTKILSELDMGLHTGNCSGAGGSTITVSGALAVGGINAKLLFYKNPAKDQPSAVADVSIAVSILPDKLPLSIPKQPPLGGAGGNPLVCVDLPAYSGHDPVCLGRCNQL